MKKNMGTADRIIRVIVAVVIAILYFTGTISGVAATVFLILAGVFVVTGFIGVCPIYSATGINTCPKKG